MVRIGYVVICTGLLTGLAMGGETAWTSQGASLGQLASTSARVSSGSDWRDATPKAIVDTSRDSNTSLRTYSIDAAPQKPLSSLIDVGSVSDALPYDQPTLNNSNAIRPLNALSNPPALIGIATPDPSLRPGSRAPLANSARRGGMPLSAAAIAMGLLAGLCAFPALRHRLRH